MSKHNDIYNILGKLSALQPKEEPKPSILREFAEPPVMKDLTTRLNERYLSEKGKITKTATGLRHEKTDWEGNPFTFKDADSDKPNMAHVNKMDNALGVKFDREKKFQGGVKVDEISQGLAGRYMDAAEKDIKSRKEVDTWDPKISKRKEGKFHAVMRKTGTVPTTDNPTHGKFLQREGEMDEDMLTPKQKKFAALADPKDKITYADKIAGAKKKVVDEEFEDQDSIENKGEYDQEGDMAKDDLSTIEDAANELDSILSSDDNLPEWVQSKINKAMDYLDTARDYMKANSTDDNSELNEGEYKDSVNKSKIPAYQRKAKGGDWKVSTKDLDDEASKSPTSRAGLEKTKERLRQQGVMEGEKVPTKTGYIHKGSYGSDYQGSDGNDDDYDEWGNEKKKKTATSDTPKKRGRPKKHTGPERVTSKAWKHKGGRVSEAYRPVKLDTFVEDTIAEMDSLLLTEKAKSKAQQKFMGMVHAAQKGEKPASKEVAKVAKGMSKKDAKDFASTKHKGLPKKVTESVLTESTIERIAHQYSKEVKDFMTTGDLDDDLFSALYDYYFDDMPYGTKKARDGDPYEWVADRFYADMGGDKYNGGPDSLSPIPPSVNLRKDDELTELARLAGLGEMDRSEYIQQQDTAAERSGKDSFNAFGQTFDTDEVNESNCNMTAEGEYCPEHGMNECGMGMYESKGSKPDFLDVDKDGNKKEPMKKAIKDKEKVDECGDMGPMSNMPTEQDSGMNINSSMDTKTGRKTLSVTADGEAAEQLAQMLKMAGLAGSHDHHDHDSHNKVVLVKHDEEVAEDFSNEPNQQYATTDNIVNAGQDLNRKKKQYADKPKAGDNPMATEDIALEGRLAELYNSLKIKTK